MGDEQARREPPALTRADREMLAESLAMLAAWVHRTLSALEQSTLLDGHAREQTIALIVNAGRCLGALGELGQGEDLGNAIARIANRAISKARLVTTKGGKG